MLEIIGAPSPSTSLRAGTITAGKKGQASAGPSLVVIICLMFLIAVGVSFLVIRWRVEARMSLVEDQMKKTRMQVTEIKDSLVNFSTSGDATSTSMSEILLRLSALELSMASTTQNMASNTLAINSLFGQSTSSTTEVNSPITTAPVATIEQPIITAVSAPLSKSCTEPARILSGRTLMPISSKYAQLDILGQIFTALDCGQARVAQIAWLENSPKGGLQYSFGLEITLKETASYDLLALLNTLGFKCVNKKDNSACLNWTADKVLTVQELNYLKPYASEMAGDGSLR